MSKNEMTTTTLSVNTRRGPITFETALEWPEAVALCRQDAQNGNNFANDLVTREDKGLFMSESQVCWVYKIAEDVRQLREPKTTKVRSTDASDILASLAEARAKGIKKPILRLQRANGVEIQLKYMSVGKNAGGAWVTMSGDLIGKIDDGGVFTFTGRPYTDQLIDEVFGLIESAHNDLEGALRSYGKMTSRCGCCGLPLTNDLSVAIGIGPICRDKFGL